MSAFFVSVYEFFYTAFNLIGAAFSSFRIVDLIDIAVIAFVIYKVIVLFRDTRSKPLLKGIFILLLVWLIAGILDLVVLKWAYTKVVDYVIIAVLIIFQPELRHALERVGYSKINFLGFASSGERETDADTLSMIDKLCKAVGSMHDTKTGALVVIERDSMLSEIEDSGTVVDASVSPELVCNIFYPKSPLHDGAMIIRDNKIRAAACILPLTSNTDVDKELGTRHRAAIGVSEASDAAVVVVSEETGIISLVINGSIKRGYNPQSLREELKKILVSDENNKRKDNIFIKVKNVFTSKEDGEDKDHV